ncbi:hypothetical protein CONLIGDRAFT_691688 [Coniochaeta ligniaria NRRL 30616]|uniref:Uncharacterized protein n=1 Tax=Coniochaeta ligniaria NRRL 30616 TaxID=1408157 RepID=A0A1J7ITH3_9PEZI|nr:hypothetical protein CONLIGDRAFT_691688 [Coniochaeta ligniaria NRRL 30616]
MFLHSGASLHGHEYSSDRPPAAGQHTYKRSPLLRSAFATPKPRPASLDAARPPTAAGPRRPSSDFVPRLPEPVVRFLEPEDKETLASMTEDAVSIMSGSEFSDGSQPSEAATVTPSEAPSSRRRRSRASSRASRKTTTFALAYPAPRFAGKKRVLQKVAPKLFLQLQQVSLDRRPRPVLDVFPSSRIAGPVIAPRLAKRFPGLFGPKGELGSADVVLMRSEDYDTVSEDVDSEDEEGRLEQRQPVAVLSPVKKSEQTEIVLEDGSVWVAHPLPTGSFDFVRTDEHGNTTTARWARRPVSKTAPASTDPASIANRITPESDVKYTFSIINPDSRRHPVMATLTPQFLDIQDTYTSVSTSSGRYPPCRTLTRSATVNVAQQQSSNTTPTKPPLARAVSTSAAEQQLDARRVQTPEPHTERTTHPVDESTKLLISVTAVFLALESGWSPYFRPHAHHPAADHHHPPAADSSMTSSTTTTDRPASRCKPPRNNRRNSYSDDYIADLPPQKGNSRDHSPVPSFATPLAPAPWWESPQSPPPPPLSATTTHRSSQTPTHRPPPRRATSTGAAFMQRARIASAQHFESSDSEHGGATSKARRPAAQREKERDRATARHSMPPPSEHGLLEVDMVVVTVGQNGVGDTNARPHSRKDRERKVQSAYYPASPPMVTVQSDGARGVELVAGLGLASQVTLEMNSRYQHQAPATVVEGRRGSERGFGGRMRSLGHWFRRLGGNNGHGH